MRNFGGFGRLTPSVHGLSVPGRGVAAGGAGGAAGPLTPSLIDALTTEDAPIASICNAWDPADRSEAGFVRDIKGTWHQPEGTGVTFANGVSTRTTTGGRH